MTFAAWVFLAAFLVSAFLLTCSLVACHERINMLERQIGPEPDPDFERLPRRGFTRDD